ncbi:LLM class flavin-dependent oxidoreductase [Nostoc sp. FACHB-87]|uniref:LLM class flavin-dependent oxidoreductase n=1 Tax=Nostocaceae TaxID=1162 RepID=UPI0016862EBF|nr:MULTISPECIES: LLM class flavin-dependent oxidoreductase [Nostocaceae]MBD2435550.1 LLM class flavin-dependent oxidoreductase [Nostoc sp. FACHB-110]MBD2454056.1 LLM class flavin-dependent oxidoreductase [Nostoc sp. FACHB-87]MBD2476249.1 LLM class flavin-dependent oxidoreductase [Anabaena sp. FACHB-83]
MPVEFIGMIGTRNASELHSPTVSITGGSIDLNYVRNFAKVHEDGGFDRVLVGYSSTGPDGFNVVSYVAAATERLKFLLAHRPGFVSPSLAARKLATLDHFSNGRVAVHIITGGSDAEQQRDGDWLDHDTRYRRTDEYLDVVRRVWTSQEPFDYEGEFYQFKGAFSDVKPLQQPHIPIYFGGASGAAVGVGAKHSNVYAFWGEPIGAIKQRIAEVKAAAPPGKDLRFSISLRPILGETEAKAWEKAHYILSRINEIRGQAPAVPEAVGSLRLLDFAKEREIHDKRLWTPIAAATGARGNTTALVGTPEQVAESLFDYYKAGVTTLLIRGFDPVEDALAYGRDVIPLVRQEVQRLERQTATVA